jgi:8-oxo-dGTP diphosphatase|tara:strand:+ start:892 stop:1443 length:552 start_codon:yes stop_codon:yes gene_type:complete
MPHIHTKPGQHDITVSAWIIRIVDSEPKVLVHMHRKHGKLMQVGGHIELDETPWQTLAHEMREESGYDISELKILQPTEKSLQIQPKKAVTHPVSVVSNTHKISDDHYHSDYGYAFIADSEPVGNPAEGESTDLRWLTIAELKQAAEDGYAFEDVVAIYKFIVEQLLSNYYQIDATQFSLEKP